MIPAKKNFILILVDHIILCESIFNVDTYFDESSKIIVSFETIYPQKMDFCNCPLTVATFTVTPYVIVKHSVYEKKVNTTKFDKTDTSIVS